MNKLLAAAADRLIPGDDWPSATAGGVLDYVARRAAEDPATWSDVILPGLQMLDAEASKRHGVPFEELQPDAHIVADDRVRAGPSQQPADRRHGQLK